MYFRHTTRTKSVMILSENSLQLWEKFQNVRQSNFWSLNEVQYRLKWWMMNVHWP